MPRIAMVVLSGYPSDPRVRREAEALAEIGIEVDVYCTRHPGEQKVEHLGAITAYRLIDHRRNKESMSRYIRWSLAFMGAVMPVLLARTLRRRYRCIQVHNLPDYLVFAALPQKLLGIPVILDLHDLSVELYSVKWNGNGASRLKKTVELAERYACRFANAVITTSDGFRERLVSRGVPTDKITLVLNTADNRIFKFRKRRFYRLRKSLRILYHGTVADRFGIETVIRAVDLLKQRIPGIRFTIHGNYDPSCRERLETLVRELRLRTYVSFGDYLPLERIREIIVASDVGVVPYESDPFMHLALSTKTFEYVAMGLPVVASRLDSLERIFDDHCVKYVRPGDPGALAEALVDLCHNPARRRNLVECAAGAYHPLGWNTMSARYRNLVLNLMGNGTHERELDTSLHDSRGAGHVRAIPGRRGLGVAPEIPEPGRPCRSRESYVR